ncbi:transcriptional regulator with AAA-type ATPase domain [Clostridium beijerinckii]|nr:transcriptional regulator with AAA-type ATPase domain [Clostridium beijerinckii]
MYQYSKYIKKLPEDAPFVVFNCADYANNPQLLLSYIFGHIKGAFTGADKEKEGIVEKADGGILFLDEIHRLPPEGQEMIFYLWIQEPIISLEKQIGSARLTYC